MFVLLSAPIGRWMTELSGTGMNNEFSGTVNGPAVQAQNVQAMYLQADGSRPERPWQIPRPPAHFVDRAEILGRLTALVRNSQRRDVAHAVVLGGFAGVGKTALAMYWAHSVRDAFPDGQLYVNLLGFAPTGSPLSSSEAIRCVLDSYFGADRIPATEQGRENLYRSILAERRVLLLLDNARDADHVRPLLPYGSGCFTLITSRNRLAGLTDTSGVVLENLELLSKADAHELLARRLGEERCRVEEHELGAIVDLCSRLPLALSIIAARAAERPAVPLSEFRVELTYGGARLDALDAGGAGANMRAAISWTFSKLDPAEQRLFRLLGLHPGEELAISVAAAAALAGVPVAAARRILGGLVRAQMLADLRPGWFTAHDLLREYSIAEARLNLGDDERAAAIGRLSAYYLFTAYSGAMALRPTREVIDLPTLPDGVRPEALQYDDALQWFSEEHRNLKAVVLSTAFGAWEEHAGYAWRLAWSMVNYLDWQGHWKDLAEIEDAGVAAARRSGNRIGEALCLRYLGGAHTLMREYSAARTCLLAALELSRELGDAAVQARILMNLGWTAEEDGALDEAIDYSRQSLDLFRSKRMDAGQANALYAVGRCMSKSGSFAGALDYLGESLDLFQRIKDPYGEAGAEGDCGRAYQGLGDHSRAVECFEKARAVYGQLGARRDLANVLIRLGDSRIALGEIHESSLVWREALDILSELRHPDVAEVEARLARGEGPESEADQGAQQW